jgi:aminoglycoside/choline kinase family phosphotransferase
MTSNGEAILTSTSPVNLSKSATALVAETLGADSASIEIARVTGDASTRTYFRALAGDRSLIIAKYASPFEELVSASDRLVQQESSNPSARLTFANDPCAHLETTALFLESGLPVPRILGCAGSEAILLLEDVGDLRLQDWLSEHEGPEAAAAYREALEMVVKIQEATQRASVAGSICSNLAFDEAKLRWELGFFFANYFNRHLHVRLDPETATSVQADFKALSAELASRPRVLTHRDYHARNLMMHRGRMYIIDFQDARMGPASYDVASLLSDPYSKLSRDAAVELAEEFIEMKARSTLPLPDRSAFESELQLMTVQRMLKAIGTYSSQAVAGNDIYLPYIKPAIDRALAAMAKLNRFQATSALLQQSLN